MLILYIIDQNHVNIFSVKWETIGNVNYGTSGPIF